MPDPNQVKLATPQDAQQQAATNISDQLKAVYGEEHQVIPVTSESSPVDLISQDLDRVIFNKPGYEPSKNFLKKMMERVKKKNPDAQVKLKD